MAVLRSPQEAFKRSLRPPSPPGGLRDTLPAPTSPGLTGLQAPKARLPTVRPTTPAGVQGLPPEFFAELPPPPAQDAGLAAPGTRFANVAPPGTQQIRALPSPGDRGPPPTSRTATADEEILRHRGERELTLFQGVAPEFSSDPAGIAALESALDASGQGNFAELQLISDFSERMNLDLTFDKFERFKLNVAQFDESFLSGLADRFGNSVYGFDPVLLQDIITIEQVALENDDISEAMRDLTIGDAIRTFNDEEASRENIETAIGTLETAERDLVDFANSIFDPTTGDFVDPDRQSQREYLERLASGEQGIISDEQIDLAFQNAVPEIDRFLATQSNRIGTQMAASGVGRGSFAQQLAFQANTQSLQARVGLSNELREFQLSTNAQMQSHFMGLLQQSESAEDAFRLHINEISRGISFAIADLQSTPVSSDVDLSPFLVFADASRWFAAQQEFFDKETGFDPVRDFFDIVGGSVTQLTSRATTGILGGIFGG